MQEINSLDQISKDGLALTYIGTTWCPYCGKTTKALSEVMPEHADVQLAKIDGDDEPDILSTVGATTYPQILLHRDGQLVAQRESCDTAELRTWLAENGVA
jgi:thioredoxin-like negative regulator of GroEL